MRNHATYEASFLRKKSLICEVGRIVLLFGLCGCHSCPQSASNSTRGPFSFLTPLLCQHGCSNLTSASLLLHVAEGCAVKATTLRFCVYFSCFCPVMLAGRRIACSVRIDLGRSLSACELSLRFNRDSFPQFPPFCLLHNYSYFQCICFRLLSHIQYLFQSVFVGTPVFYLFVRRFPFDLHVQYPKFETYYRANWPKR